MEQVWQFTFNLALLAQALGMPEADARAVLTDPRIATPIVKQRIASDLPGWKMVPAPGGVSQLRAPGGGRWLVKTISDLTDFRPAAQIGKGRHTNAAAVARHWNKLAGYVLLDMNGFPHVVVYGVPIATLTAWQQEGRLDADFRVDRATLVGQLLPNVPDQP